MGAWGPGNFENDSALDWLGADNLGVAHVERALRADGDSDECEHALAAAELVAAWNGHPAAELPTSAEAFLERRRGGPKPELVAKARECVAAIVADSELLALWKDDGNPAPWKAVQQDLLERLGRTPAARPAPSAHPRPRAVLHIEKRLHRGVSMGTTRDFRSEGLPVLEPAAIAGVDLGMDFTAEELTQIAGWLRATPDVTVSLSDISRVRGYKHDPARIVPFARARKLRLHLDRARDVAFLDAFQDLEELIVRVKCVLELPAMAKLRTLVVQGAKMPERWGPLPALESLHLPTDARPVGLDSLPALRFLFAGAHDLDAIAALPLRGLSLSGVEKDTDLGPLATSTTIEMLELRVHTAAQVATVARLPLRNLRLWIPDGAGVDLVDPLRGHATIERVMVSGSGWQRVRAGLLEMRFREGEFGDWPTD
jgi:hypothetical protein